MKRFAQINNDKVHWIFDSEEKPNFAPNIVLIDITGNNTVKEGWYYKSDSGEFTEQEPIQPEEKPPTIEEMQMQTLLNTEYLVVMSELTNI